MADSPKRKLGRPVIIADESDFTTPEEVKEAIQAVIQGTRQANDLIDKKIVRVADAADQHNLVLKGYVDQAHNRITDHVAATQQQLRDIALTPGDKGDKGDDGDDADEDAIFERLLESIKSPDTQIALQVARDSSEDIRNKLELLTGDDRLDASAIRNLSDFMQKDEGITRIIGTNKPLWALEDVNLIGLTTGQSIEWNGTQWIPYTPGSGGSITLTTTGTSGVATLTGSTLNIPNYTYALPTASTSVLGGVKVDGTTITISGGVISAATGGAGTVSSVSVVSANGFAGTVANPTSTPAITLTTSVTGILKGNGTAISAATAGTDYIVPAAAFTAGSVPFANASGQLAQDNSNFFYDGTNHRLGIGTSSPGHSFDAVSTTSNLAGTFQGMGGRAVAIGSSSASGAFIQGYTSNAATTATDLKVQPGGGNFLITGNTGIGDNSPTYPLSLALSNSGSGMIKLMNTSASGYDSIDFFNSSGTQVGGFGYGNASTGIYSNEVYFYSSGKSLVFAKSGGGTDMVLSGSNGYLGLNQSSPVAPLDVRAPIVNAAVTPAAYFVNAGTGNLTGASVLAGYNEASSASAGFSGYFMGTGMNLGLIAQGSELATLTYTGYFGIGNTSPSYNLDVNGTARIGTLNGLIKGTTGVLSAATAGTDYQAPITLTTTGTSGAATFSGGTLNIPQYSGAGTTINNYTNTIKVDQTPASGTYGTLAGLVNGSNTVYTVSNGSYVSGTLEVQLNGQIQTQGASYDWVETTPGSGTFTFNIAPPTGAKVQARYTTQSTSTGNTPYVLSTKTSAYTIATTDKYIRADGTSGAFSVTLPTVSTVTGYEFIIKKIDSSANVITVVGTIDGATNYLLSTQYKYVRVISNGTNWDIIGNN